MPNVREVMEYLADCDPDAEVVLNEDEVYEPIEFVAMDVVLDECTAGEVTDGDW